MYLQEEEREGKGREIRDRERQGRGGDITISIREVGKGLQERGR